MQWDPDLPNNNQIYNKSYTPGGYEKAKLRRLLWLVSGVILIIAIGLFIIHISQTDSQQSKYTKAAALAARKQNSNAQATNVKVAGGFAIAIISDPSAQGQANAGYETIFKVNKNGSMSQIASGSSFGPLDLLELGIPLTTQTKLTGNSLGQVQQNLANQCGYSDGVIGYSGFDGSFNPGGWQIDSATLSTLEQKLSSVISNKNAGAQSAMRVICVNATKKNSNDTINKTTYISTFTFQVQFITPNGTITTHIVTFSIGPNYYHSYTLDEHDI